MRARFEGGGSGLEAGDAVTLGIRTEDGYGGSGRVLFSGVMWPNTCDEPTAGPGTGLRLRRQRRG